jgi:DNA polymerase-1
MIKRPVLMLIDAMSQVFRAYYAIRGLATSQGIPTNATYGLLLMLNRVLEKFPPDYVAMVFDSSEPTPRHIRYPEYKATRERMPSDLVEQLPYIRRLCGAMSIPAIEVPGQEADDVIGTLARRASEAGIHPLIVTIDKDMMQLVDEDTFVLNTSRDDLLVGPDQVRELFGVAPENIVDLLGLQGDSSDNIPGAPGIGQKGARALLERFGTVENAMAHASEVSAKRQRESLLEHRDQILLSKELVTIDTHVEVDVEWEALRMARPDRQALIGLLRELEFTSQLKEQLARAASDTDQEGAIETVETSDAPDLASEVAFHLGAETLSVWDGRGPAYRIPLEGPAARTLLASAAHKTTHNLKLAMLRAHTLGIAIAPPWDDTLLMAYLISPNRGRYELDALVGEAFAQKIDRDEVVWIHRLAARLRPQIREELEDLYTRIELPASPVLAGMEEAGIRLDVGVLAGMSVAITSEMETLTGQIYQLAGDRFNINSPRQLGVVLFEKLNLPPSRKLRKSGQYSTSVEVLEDLAATYELPRLILDYRQRARFKSTYVDVLPTLLGPDGRLHTSFNQTGAATGRLSSSDPNLQNIPIRTELGRHIRRAFIPAEGSRLVAADYSQVELRILAHLSGDAGLIGAFLDGADIHTSTAAEVLGVPFDQVTPDDRRRAKAVNFGIVYGQTPFGLARSLGISREEAGDFIDRYFARYPGVRDYIEHSLAEARERGATRTLFGRIRQIPEINSRNPMRRSGAERMAINAPIQGSAADIIKLAMIRIADELERGRLSTRMVLQVHDELIFEIPEAEMGIAENLRDWMSGVAELKVPLVVDVKAGPNWRDMTPIPQPNPAERARPSG